MLRFDTNFDDVQRKLSELQKRASALHGQRQVPLGELMTPAFLAAHTDCASLDELFQRGGFAVASPADFEQIPEDELDQVVAAHSQFKSWAELLQAAGQEWVRRQLGF